MTNQPDKADMKQSEEKAVQLIKSLSALILNK